ncbi:MAG: EAL domain-containing protein [Gallionellaceae bacterium]
MRPYKFPSIEYLTRLPLRVVWGALLVNLFMAILVGMIIYQNHRQQEASAEATTQSLAHVLEESIAGNIKKIDISMLAVSDEIDRLYASGGINRKALDAFLIRQQARMPDIDSMRVADEHGFVQYGQGVQPKFKVGISDRKHFTYLRDHNTRELFVGDPIFARINKKWVLPIARRLNHPDGTFAGSVYSFIALDQISEDFSHVEVGAHGVVNLRDGEMRNIVRFPEPRGVGTDIGKNTMSPPLLALLEAGKDTGTYRVHAVLDNVDRTYSYRKIEGTPLYVTVGFSADDYLAEWRNFSARLLAFLTLFVVLTSWATWLLYRGEKRRNAATNELEALNKDFLTLLENTTDFIYFKDKDSRIRFCSQTMANITGHQSWREMVGKHDFEIFPENTARIYYEEELPVFRDGAPILNRVDPYFDAQGKQCWVNTNKWPVFADDGKTVIGIFGISRDISQYKQAELALAESESRLRTIIENEPECIKIVDTEGLLTQMNPAGLKMIEADTLDQVAGRPVINVIAPEYRKAFTEMHRQVIAGKSMQMEFEVIGINGGRRWLETHAVPMQDNGKTVHLAVTRDISERKQHEKQLEHIAHYDALTNLPNRVLLADRLHQGMTQALRRGQRLAVAYLDLDGFKAVNDLHGHDAGDQLLIAVATRMKQALREGDTLARLGGDEFVAVLIDLVDIEASVQMITRLLAAAAEPIYINDLMLHVSASLGVTFYPQADEVDADQLLRQADQAMYEAKLAGKNRYYVFDADQASNIRGHHESLERIRRALTSHEFVLHYQPKVNMRTGAVIGAEALIRWQHPEKGLLPPSTFLPVIEDHPLAVDIGEWVIATALNQIDFWHAEGLDIPVSINVGAYQLQKSNFVERLHDILSKHPHIKPSCIELEVLETSALEDISHISQVLEDCRKIGVHFSLDDFGTGYSSLTYLKQLPVATLKIDQSFVRNMLDDPDDLAILQGVLGLATAFNREVIAEGVETIEHGALLLELGCDHAQGYGIARPMPSSQMPAWAASWRPDPAWANVKHISSDDLVLLFARVEHRAWIVKIEKYLMGGATFPQLDMNQCRFGQLLNAYGLTRYQSHPAFQAANELHLQVHELASELVALHIKGENAQAQARLHELHLLRDKLLEQLKQLAPE